MAFLGGRLLAEVPLADVSPHSLLIDAAEIASVHHLPAAAAESAATSEDAGFR
jgi:hypothetical protein